MEGSLLGYLVRASLRLPGGCHKQALQKESQSHKVTAAPSLPLPPLKAQAGASPQQHLHRETGAMCP